MMKNRIPINIYNSLLVASCRRLLSYHKFCRFVGQERQVAHCGGIRDLKIRDFDTNDILRDLLVPDLEPVSLFLLNRTQNLRSEMGL